MVKYFFNETDIKSKWDHVFSAFWQRYPNPFSTHVLTEDVVFRKVTEDHQLVTRRLLTKTNRLPRWAERFFPTNLSRSVYILEDSVVDPINKRLTTYTWNLNHTTLMTVRERCVFQESENRPAWTELKREAWISSGVYGFSRPIQEFGLARFKSNQAKAMKGLEYALANLHGDGQPWHLRDSVKDASEKAKETVLAASEKAKHLASAAAASPQKPSQYV
ncbi:PRELI domain-containing protein 1, mitochondrial-like [Chanos chanos]|uniref:PRELI domain-containing protein 1, mitochondrial-like n=1 Tax=Chanos chanos TaxID=29144 RepID=A0A6J2WHR0_CHACN|nr:PRELI domain-containing protein 1, mitochondrial-like [Chanos chanos]